jgi:hypothetical protein
VEQAPGHEVRKGVAMEETLISADTDRSIAEKREREREKYLLSIKQTGK